MFFPTPMSPKCAIYVRRSANIKPTLAFSEADCFLGIRLAADLTIYNLYSPGRQHAVCHLFHGFRPDKNAIVCGDFNSHHKLWYGRHASEHHKHLSGDSRLPDKLVEDILARSLKLLNTPGENTHYPRNGHSPSIVDLTFARGQANADVLG